MPRPRPLAKYPLEYAAWIVSAYLHGEHRVICSDPRALRGHLYAFRGALRNSASPFLAKAEAVSFHVEPETLVIRRKGAIS